MQVLWVAVACCETDIMINLLLILDQSSVIFGYVFGIGNGLFWFSIVCSLLLFIWCIFQNSILYP